MVLFVQVLTGNFSLMYSIRPSTGLSGVELQPMGDGVSR